MVSHTSLALSVVAISMSTLTFVPPTQGEEANWKAKWEATVQAAKKEGQVNTYGLADVTHPAILKAFNKRYPEIKVVTVFGHNQVVHRVVAERRARKNLGDVFASGPRNLRTAYRAKFLQPIRPILMLPEVTDTSNWYGNKHIWGDPEKKYLLTFEGTPSSASMAYNTKKLINPNQIQSYWDVLNPRWRSKIGMYSYGGGSSVPTPMLVLYYNARVGPKFIKRLFAEMDVTFTRDRRQATDWLGRGKYTICFMCRRVEQAKKAGLPIESFPSDQIKEAGSIGGGNSSVIAFFDNAPHPNAAKVFINWFLSREGQITWQRVLNTIVGDGSDSFRNDIPKDDVQRGYRRTKGRKYRELGFLDPKPALKFYWRQVKTAQKRKRENR